MSATTATPAGGTRIRFSAERSLSRQWADDHANANFSAFRRGIDGNDAPVYWGDGRDDQVGTVTYARLFQDVRKAHAPAYPHLVEVEGLCEDRFFNGTIGVEKIVIGVSADTGAVTIRRIHLADGQAPGHLERVLQRR